MARVKIKDIEGEPMDIHNLFQQGGCDFSSYIGADSRREKISTIYIILLVGALLFSALFVKRIIFEAGRLVNAGKLF